MPHAWKAGEQTLLLRRQLEAMDDGGTVVISVPANPFRCPPGPYERASLIAYYLKTRKPRSKLVILDAKDAFSKQRLFLNAWKELYPDMLEWVPLSKGGAVTEVDPATRTFITDFGKHQANVGNVIPAQKAGRIAEIAGVADRTGWCPIDPVTFESKLRAEYSCRGRRRVCWRYAEIGLRGQRPSQSVRRSPHAAAAWGSSTDAEADQHLLQLGGAGLRHIHRRCLSTGERATHGDRRFGRCEFARCAALDAGA